MDDKRALVLLKARPGYPLAELLLRQEALIRRVLPWEPLDYDGKRVVEIGCGPLAGLVRWSSFAALRRSRRRA